MRGKVWYGEKKKEERIRRRKKKKKEEEENERWQITRLKTIPSLPALMCLPAYPPKQPEGNERWYTNSLKICRNIFYSLQTCSEDVWILNDGRSAYLPALMFLPAHPPKRPEMERWQICLPACLNVPARSPAEAPRRF